MSRVEPALPAAADADNTETVREAETVSGITRSFAPPQLDDGTGIGEMGSYGPRGSTLAEAAPELIGMGGKPQNRRRWTGAGKKVGMGARILKNVNVSVAESLTKPLAEALLSVRHIVQTRGFRMTEIGPILEPKSWADACRAKNGVVYCAPQNSPRILAMNPATGAYTPYGRDLGEASNKFSSIVLAPDNCLYAIPASFNRVVKIDPTTTVESDKVTLVSGDLGDGAYKWQQACLDTDSGNIYAAPSNGLGLLEVNPHTGEKKILPSIRVLGEEQKQIFRGGNMYFGCGYDSTSKRIILAPANAHYFMAFYTETGQFREIGKGCLIWKRVRDRSDKFSRCLILHGKMYCAPCHLSRICVFDLKKESAQFIGPDLGGTGFKYIDVIVGADGNIWFIPGEEGHLLVVDRQTHEVKQVGEPFDKGSFNAVVRAGCGPEGQQENLESVNNTFLYCIPCYAKRMVRINTSFHLSLDEGKHSSQQRSMLRSLSFGQKGQLEPALDSNAEDPPDAMYDLWTQKPQAIVHGLLHNFFFYDVVEWIRQNTHRCSWSFGIYCTEIRWLVGMAGSEILGRICSIKNEEVRTLLLKVSLHGEVLGPLRSSLQSATEIEFGGYDLTKWCGAARSKDGRLFFVPLNEARVLVLNPQDGRLTHLEPHDALPSVRHDSVLYTTAVLGLDGAIYGVPGDAKEVLRINPARAAGAEDVVTTIPIDVASKRHLTPQDTNLHNTSRSSSVHHTIADQVSSYRDMTSDDPLDDRRKWMGSAMASDGIIYCAPYAANTILKIDSSKNVPEVTEIPLPSKFCMVEEKFVGAVYSNRTRCVYFIPANAEAIMKYVPHENDFSYVGQPEESGLRRGLRSGDPYKFTGCAIAVDKNDEEKIFTAPCHATKLLIFNTKTEKSVWAKCKTEDGRTVDFELSSQIEWKYSGVLQLNGQIFVIPGNCGQALSIDPTSNEVKEIGEELPVKFGRVYVGQGIAAHDRFIYCSTRNRHNLVRLDGMYAETRAMEPEADPFHEMLLFWRERPTLWFVGLTHNLFRSEFLAWFEEQSEKAGGPRWLRDSCGLGTISSNRKTSEQLSTRIASIPNVVQSILEIRNIEVQKLLLSVPLVQGALINEATVGPWLTHMLAGDEHCRESAVCYLEEVSKIPGFEVLIPRMAQLQHLCPTTLQLDIALKRRVAKTPLILGVLDVKFQRPLAILFVTIDFVMMWAFVIVFGVTAEYVISDSIDGNSWLSVGALFVINTLAVTQEIILQRSLFSVSKTVLLRYLSSPWNSVRVMANLGGYIICAIAFAPAEIKTGTSARVALSFVGILLFAQVLAKLRGLSQDMATVVTTINTVIGNLAQFLFVVFSLMVTFAYLFYLVLHDAYIEVWQTPTEALLTVLRLMLGDFDREWFEGGNEHISRYSIVLYALFTFAGTIVMLNVLIAVVSENYNAAKQRAVINYFVSMLEFVAALDTMGVTDHSSQHFYGYTFILRCVSALPKRTQNTLHHTTPEEMHRADRFADMQYVIETSLEKFHKRILESERRLHDAIATVEQGTS